MLAKKTCKESGPSRCSRTNTFIASCATRQHGVKVMSVGCGAEHSLFISSDGKLFSCGNGAQGQLGQGNTRDFNYPKLVGGDLAQVKVAGASGGDAHTVVCTTDGDVFYWGFGERD